MAAAPTIKFERKLVPAAPKRNKLKPDIATLAGIILGSITVLIIDRKFLYSAYFAMAGAVLTFFGLIHSEAIGVFRTPEVALSYAIAAGFLVVCAKREGSTHEAAVPAPIIEHGVGETA